MIHVLLGPGPIASDDKVQPAHKSWADKNNALSAASEAAQTAGIATPSADTGAGVPGGTAVGEGGPERGERSPRATEEGCHGWGGGGRGVGPFGAHTPQADATIRAVFERFDANRSGRLDYSELRNCLLALGIDVTPPEAARVLAQYDADRSGLMELDEFARLSHSLGYRPA